MRLLLVFLLLFSNNLLAKTTCIVDKVTTVSGDTVESLYQKNCKGYGPLEIKTTHIKYSAYIPFEIGTEVKLEYDSLVKPIVKQPVTVEKIEPTLVDKQTSIVSAYFDAIKKRIFGEEKKIIIVEEQNEEKNIWKNKKKTEEKTAPVKSNDSQTLLDMIGFNFLKWLLLVAVIYLAYRGYRVYKEKKYKKFISPEYYQPKQAPKREEKRAESTPVKKPVEKEVKKPTIKITPPTKAELIEQLQARVIGHRPVLNKIASTAILRFLSNKQKPMMMLLMGPTGVGKTEIAKALADSLKVKLHRFDMGEYSKAEDEWKLRGASTGYSGARDGGMLPNAMREHEDGSPCVILLDEVEKAHEKIYQSLLQFADEGHISDAIGKVQAPTCTIVIMTSNLKVSADWNDDKKLRENLIFNHYFSKEFIGRIEVIENLSTLSEEEMERLCRKTIMAFFAQFEITVDISDKVYSQLIPELKEEIQMSGARGVHNQLANRLSEQLVQLKEKKMKKARFAVYDGEWWLEK